MVIKQKHRRRIAICTLFLMGLSLLSPFTSVYAEWNPPKYRPPEGEWSPPKYEAPEGEWNPPDYTEPEGEWKGGTGSGSDRGDLTSPSGHGEDSTVTPSDERSPEIDNPDTKKPKDNSGGGDDADKGENKNDNGNWLAPVIKATGSIAGKLGYYYNTAHKQGLRLLTVYEGTEKTGYLLTGKPKSKLENLLKGKYYQEGTKLGLKNNFTSFGKGFLREAKAGGTWAIGIGLAAWSAYDEFKQDGLTTNVAAEFLNETVWNVGVGATSMAVGSAAAGWLAGTATGAALGSSVPIVGTAVGAVVGAAIGWGLSTPTGQKIKNKTKKVFKKGIDKVKSWFS